MSGNRSSAALLGRHAVANLIKSSLSILGVSITGYVSGWRIRGSVLETLGAYALMVGFACAMIWIGVLLGSLVGTPKGVNGIAFAVQSPLTFIGSTIVLTVVSQATVIAHQAVLRAERPRVRVELEVLDTVPSVQNYGHGGLGATLSWGVKVRPCRALNLIASRDRAAPA